MIGMTPADRWTCPRCLRTEIPNVPEAAMHAAIVRVQQLHAHRHATDNPPKSLAALAADAMRDEREAAR